MITSLKEYLENRLNLAFRRPWANQPIITYELEYFNGEGSHLSGKISFWSLGRKTGAKICLQETTFSDFNNQESIDDWLAHTFSSMLMHHTKWPK